MSKFVWEDAWVLLAVKYAQGEKNSASRDEVIDAGDFINHAILLDQELEHAIQVLGDSSLINVKEDTFSLGFSFHDLWSRSGAEKHRSVHKQLEKLKVALGII